MFRNRISDAQLFIAYFFFCLREDKIVAGNDWLTAANQYYHQITNRQRIQFRTAKDMGGDGHCDGTLNVGVHEPRG